MKRPPEYFRGLWDVIGRLQFSLTLDRKQAINRIGILEDSVRMRSKTNFQQKSRLIDCG